MSEVQLDSDGAMRQAGMTAEHYLNAAYKILTDGDWEFNTSDAIELSKVMATDFHTCMMCMKMQEIRDSVNLLAEQLDNRWHNRPDHEMEDE